MHSCDTLGYLRPDLYYKITNGLLDTDIRNNFIVADNLNIRGHSCKLIKHHCTMDATKFYFSVFGTLRQRM